jgi:hypothetical protein
MQKDKLLGLPPATAMSYSVDVQAKERLYKEVGKLMVDHGFVADGPYWRRKSNETIASLFIENYHSSFLSYVSVGVYVIGLSNKRTRKPKLGQMHGWTRLAQLTPATTRPQIALKGDGTEDTSKMVDEVVYAIRNVGLEILDELSSLEGTKRLIDKYGDCRWYIGPLLKEKLYENPVIQISGTLALRDWEISGSVDPYHK